MHRRRRDSDSGDEKEKKKKKKKEKGKDEIDHDPELGGQPGNSGVAPTLNNEPTAPQPGCSGLGCHQRIRVLSWPIFTWTIGAVAGPSGPFATPASQQGQDNNNYPRDSKVSYLEPQAAQPTPSVAPDSSTSSRPLSDEKARLWAMENSPSPAAATSYFSSSPEPSLPMPSSPQPASPTTFTASSPEVRPMSMPIAGASSSASPFSHGNNLEGPHSDEPPPPSYAEAGRVGSMHA
ncbi:hypothetical protein FRC01_004231 [Tulasnella sp. 417]|nr:hypothetical protein FRC01_004231 [Tulasnella sp. 417]